MARRPTIKEVSKLAGVSFKTVSRVLNNEKNVSEETRRRVEAVVAELNFRPSMAARTLAGRKSFQVALLYDNPSPFYVYHVQAGAQERCSDLGYRLLIQPVDAAAPDLAQQVAALIDETHLDGLILTPPVTESAALLDMLDGRALPYVRISPGLRPDHGRAATIDDRAAAQEMTQRLIALGHRRIAFVGGPETHVSALQRREGYAAALSAAGISVDEALILQGDFSLRSGRSAARKLLDCDDRPDAIFAANDDMAAGVLAVAHELDIDVPGELSIAGFDDSDLAGAVWPPLSTVHQPVRELARLAADLLLAPDPAPPRITLPYGIEMRASTGPAPKKAD
ncbi:MAG: LacI family transcriptional regulator [Alphaproteobacteria bacterium HGW-Alphaproteobacteria-16]|nr:MAG: LacI family transcriptional regulator [Alphaproteobacteria bacterium HGW-Alphaproteobacteria-16]